MNSYAVIVLVALLAEYALSLVASLLTIQSLSPDLPAELRDMRDPSTYARTQDYTRGSHALPPCLEHGQPRGAARILAGWRLRLV